MARLTSQLALLLVICVICSGQQSPPTPSPDAANLTGLTTPVEVTFSNGHGAGGSGFFYFVFAEDDKKDQAPHWVSIQHIYVITAKHIIQPGRLKQLTEFKYAIRMAKDNHVEWHVLTLNQLELGQRLHLCHDGKVDVAAVEVTDKLSAEMTRLLNQQAQILQYNGTSSDHFPGEAKFLQAQPGDDVLVIGYPRGFFDTFNKLPVLKTGVLNTPIGMHFNGLDAFLLDFKYYPGSSGSLIISKPTRLAYDDAGHLQISTMPQYLFLGVYQGEEVWNDVDAESADLGLGWYYYNVEEALKNPPLIPADKQIPVK